MSVTAGSVPVPSAPPARGSVPRPVRPESAGRPIDIIARESISSTEASSMSAVIESILETQ